MQLKLQGEVGGFFLRKTRMHFKLGHFLFHGLEYLACKLLSQNFRGHIPYETIVLSSTLDILLVFLGVVHVWVKKHPCMFFGV